MVVLENKNYSGQIHGLENDMEWSRVKKSKKGHLYSSRVSNPIRQVKRQTYILSEFLKKNKIHAWIDYLVFIDNPECLVNSNVLCTDKNSLLDRLLLSDRRNVLAQSQIDAILKCLEKYAVK